MIRKIIRALLLLCAATLLLRAGEASTLQSALQDALKHLGDDDFTRREDAAKALQDLSRDREDEALPLLRKALSKATDPEVRERLTALLGKLDVIGKPAWSVEVTQIYQLPALYENRVYVGNKDNSVYCLDTSSGKVIWTYAVGGFIFKSLAVDGGRVFLIRTRRDGRPDGRIFALDAANGKELWNWQDNRKSQYFTAPIATRGALFFGRENQLFCLDALEGTVRWSFDAEDSVIAPPSVADGKLVAGLLEGTILCLNEKDGKEIWRRDLEGPARAGGVIAGDAVYAGAGNALYRLNLKTGIPEWNFHAAEAIQLSPAVKNDAVLAAFGNTIRHIDARTGREIWALDTAGHIFASPAIDGSRVSVPSLNDKLTMYCLDVEHGQELWTHVSREGGYAEPILAGRLMYIGYHGKFYTLKTGYPGPQSWPMSGGNPARTGCNDDEPKP